MSLLEDVVQAVEDIQEKRDAIVADADKLVALVEGPAAGAGSTVDLGGDAGVRKTPARVMAEAEATLLSKWPAPLTIALTFDSGTGAGPAAGEFRLGNATQNASIVLRVSETDYLANSAVGRLTAAARSTSTVKSDVLIVKFGDATKYLIAPYGAFSDAGSSRDITIGAPDTDGEFSAANPFADGDLCLVVFQPAGDAGAPGLDGAGAGDMISDDDPSVVEKILAWSTTGKHAKGTHLAALLAGAGTVSAQAIFGPWSGITLAGTTDISASNTIFVKITAGAGPVTSFGTTRDGYLRIVRADVAFTITRHATNLETPNAADVSVEAGDYLIVVRDSSEGAAKTRVVDVIKSDGRAYRGPKDIPQSLSLSGIIRPSQITSNQNNYAPTGHQTALVEVLSSDAERTITGVEAPTSGRAEMRVWPNGGTQNLVFSNENASSTAANRLKLGADFKLYPGKTLWAIYDPDPAVLRWLPLSQVLPFGALAILDRIVNLDQKLTLTGVVAPAQVTSNQNNYSGSFTDKLIWLMDTDASRNFTGLVLEDGQALLGFNKGNNNAVLKNDDAGSTSGNKFAIGSDITLAPGDAVFLWKDHTVSPKVIRALKITSAGGGGGGTTHYGVCDFKLSLATGVFHMGADITGATSIFAVPSGGGQIGLYDGVSAWTLISATEKSVKLTDAQSCTTANTDATVTVADSSQLIAGMEITGTGVPGGTTILSITNPTEIEMSANATASGTNTLTFKVPADTGVDNYSKNVGGALKLFMLKRSSILTKNTHTMQDGVEVLAADTTMRWLGAVITGSTTGQAVWENKGQRRYRVYNRYNTRIISNVIPFSASGTFYKVMGLLSAFFQVGGGGGGGSTNVAGTAGGTSSVGAHLSASCGSGAASQASPGAGGAGSGGDANWSGQGGVVFNIGITLGGSSGSTPAPGGLAGAGGGLIGQGLGASGGGGGHSEEKVMAADIGATETVTVGAAGNGGSSGEAGRPGGVRITEEVEV